MFFEIENFNDYSEWITSNPSIALSNDTTFVFDSGISLKAKSGENMQDQSFYKTFGSPIDLTNYSELRFQVMAQDIQAFKFTKKEDFFLVFELSLQPFLKKYSWYIPIFTSNIFNLITIDITDITLIDTISFKFNTNLDKTFWLDYMIVAKPEMEYDLLKLISDKLNEQIKISLGYIAEPATIGDTTLTLSNDMFIVDGSLIKISELDKVEYHQVKEMPQSLVVNFTDLKDGITIQNNFTIEAEASLIVPADFKNTSKEIFSPSITVWGMNFDRMREREDEANQYFDYSYVIPGQFVSPFGIVNIGTNSYVVDFISNTIRKIDHIIGEVTTIAGKAGEIGSNDGIGTNARFFRLQGITGFDNTLYISDSLNNTIRKMDLTTLEVTTFAGKAGEVGSNDGFGTDARFFRPIGITYDEVYLYLVDSFNKTVRKINIATAEVTTVAGTAGESGSDDGIGADARFNNPGGICTDGTYLYVSDTFNETIRKIVIATTEVTTIVGKAGEPGSNDGIGTAARLYHPWGIKWDGGDILYFADFINQIIRKIYIPTVEVTTIAGTALADGTDDGIGADARFSYPRDVALSNSTLYIADSTNYIIRKMNLSTSEVTTYAGTPKEIGSADGVILSLSGFKVRRIKDARNFNLTVEVTCSSWNLELLQLMNKLVRSIFVRSSFLHIGGVQLNYNITGTDFTFGVNEENPHSSIMTIEFWVFENYDAGTQFSLEKSTPLVETQILS